VVSGLQRAGLFELADLANQQLPDPVERPQVNTFLESHGVSRDTLISLLGGSP
jgi:hypothetical protein